MGKEQVEKMAIDLEEEFVLCGTLSSCGTKRCSQCFSKYLYEQGYRKLPDGAVILTPEERDEKKKEINKILSECDELKAEIAELKSKIEELKLKCAALQMRNEVGQGISEAANNLIKNMVKVEKKKAVQEFAEKLKKIVFEQGNPYNVPYEEFSQANVLFMVIDELLKEWL